MPGNFSRTASAPLGEGQAGGACRSLLIQTVKLRNGTAAGFPSLRAKRGGEGSGVGGALRKKEPPTRLASLATLPALATLAGEGWSTRLVRSFCLQIVADSAVEAGMTPLARAYPPLEGEA
jgi:hypothetical protein